MRWLVVGGVEEEAEAAVRESPIWCPECWSVQVVRAGFSRAGKQVVRCTECGRRSTTNLAPLPPRPPVMGVCHHCGSRDVRGRGRDRQGRQMLKCRTCGRHGIVRAYRPETWTVPCAFCGGERRQYVTAKGKRTERCRGCGGPERPPGKPGRYPYVVGICVDVVAHFALKHYVEATGLPEPEAIRRIFAAAWGTLIETGEAILDAPAPPRSLLRDLRGFVNRRRVLKTGTNREPNYYIERRVTARLDETAWKGLVAAAEVRGLTHQEAARLLLRQATPPGEPPREPGWRDCMILG